MYREVRRARSHQRPLTMMAFSIARAQPGVALDQLLERVQRETIQKYCESQLAHLLACETRESDVIARGEGKLFALLTESDHRSASLMASRVCAAAANRLGLELRMGISRFPDQALTLDKMIEDAESQLQGDARQPAAQRVRSKESLLGGASEVSERRTESA